MLAVSALLSSCPRSFTFYGIVSVEGEVCLKYDTGIIMYYIAKYLYEVTLYWGTRTMGTKDEGTRHAEGSHYLSFHSQFCFLLPEGECCAYLSEHS
jgi:hypothetical protein